MVSVLPRQAMTQSPNAMTEDIYTNGSATLGSPSHSSSREVRKIRLVQFEKVTEEPMVRTGKAPKLDVTRGVEGQVELCQQAGLEGNRSLEIVAMGKRCWTLPSARAHEASPTKGGDNGAKRSCSSLSWPSRAFPPATAQPTVDMGLEWTLLRAEELSPLASSHGFSCLPGNHAQAK